MSVLTRLKFWAIAAFLCVPAVAMAGVDLVVNHTDSPDPVAAGGVVTYTVRVTNDSFTTDATGVNTTHSVPAGVTYQGFAGAGVSCSGLSVGAAGPGTLSCTLPNLAANGGQVIFTIQLKTAGQGMITLGAMAASIEPDDQPANNTAPQTTTVNAGADLLMLKTPASASAASGSSFSWALSITNNGPDAASNLVVQDPVPTGFSVTSIPAGCTNSAGTITCNIAGPIVSGGTLSLGNVSGNIIAAGGSTVTNTASVAVSGTAPVGTPQDPVSANNSAVANVTVTAGSDVTLTKSRSVGGNLLVGSGFNFVLTPKYSGGVPSGLTITDTIPTNYTIGALAASQNGWTCAAAGQTVTCTKPSGGVAGLDQALGVITIPVTVATAGNGVTNSATIGSSSPSDPVPGNNTANDGGVNLVPPTVILGLSKTGPSPALVVAGIPFIYNITANNTGTTGYYGNVRMTDNLPAGLTVNSYTLNGWTCDLTTFPIVGPATINCDRTYTSGAPLAVGGITPALGLNVTAASTGTIGNSATVTALTCNLGSCNDGAISSYIVTSSINTGSADIRLLKNVDLPSVAAGNVLTYTLEIVNDTATYTSTSTSVVLTDTFDTLINSNVGATGAGYIGESISAGVATGASCATVVSSGGRALTCNFATIPACIAGSTCPVVTVQVRPGGDGGTRINNANAISNGTADPNHANDTASISSTIDPRADVTVTKTANPEPVAAGQNLTYVVTAHNNGPSRADAVSITDTLPLNVTFISATPSSGSCTTPGANATTTGINRTVACSLGNINNGAQQTVTIVVRPNTATRATTLTNSVTVATTTIETNAFNNSASVNSFVSPPSLDLVINKTDSVDPVAVGDNTVYTITVSNSGPSAAENVTVTDTLPASGLSFQSVTSSAGSCATQPVLNAVGGTVVCNLGYLASSSTQTVTVTMKGVAKGVVNNTATVSSDETALGYEAAGNNTVSEQTTARTKADMQVVSKIPSLTSVNLRDNFNFVVKIRNNAGAGLAEADGVNVSDTLPTNMELTGTPTIYVYPGGTTTASATPCTGGAASTSFTCALGTVSSGAEIDITLPVQLIATTSQGQVFTNTATVTSTSFDVNPANNSNSGNVTVNSTTLSGHVIRDFNNDGLVTAGDTDMVGIVITLTGTTFDGVAITRTATTTAAGFMFANLPQSDPTGYTISEGAVAETNLLDGKDTAGDRGGDAISVKNKVSGIVLGPHDTATGYIFAEWPQARVGIAKAVSGSPTANSDGTFNVTFQLVVKNLSLEALNTVTVTDQLAGVAPLFGTYNAGTLASGEYQIAAAPSGTCSGLQAGFSGSAANTTVAVVPSIAAGASCNISFALKIKPTSPLPSVRPSTGRYENQAVVDAIGTLSGQTSATNTQLQDLSNNGANPDVNGNGRANETSDNVITPVAPSFNAAVGIAKQINGNVTVDTDGSLIVPIRLVVTNVGNEPMHGVAVTDSLSGIKPLFGTYVAGGASATLTSGKYTVQTAPAFSGVCTNGSTSAGYTGDTGNTTIATISAMATTASCTIDFTFRFMPTTATNYTTATTYTNQAQVNGTSDYTSSAVGDLSDNGSNPDPNGNGNPGDAGENDPTPIPVPRIGIAKSAGGVARHIDGDGTYTVPFTLTISNMGQTALNNVQITDAIAGVLPQFGAYTSNAVPAAGQYTIVKIADDPINGGLVVSNQTNGASLTVVSDGTFTGSGAGNALLVAASSSLPNFGASTSSSAQVTFTVRFSPTTAGPFNNAATATASPPGGGTVTDNSVDGGNPDLNGNGDPTDDTSPTVVNLNSQYIGAAKAVGAVVQTGAKRFRIPYTLIVKNTNSPLVTATNVQLTDNLRAAFPTAQSIAISTPAAISSCTGTVLTIAVPAFTGIGQNNLLSGNQNLQPGESCTITFTTEVDFGSNALPTTVQNNQATATTSQTAGGTIIATDLSDNGSNPDANNNGNPSDAGENDPTPVSFSSANLAAVSGKVYLDSNHNRADDDGASAPNVSGFIVEVLNASSQVVGSATTDSSGSYTVAGLFPSTAGNVTTYYSLRFRTASGAIYGMPLSADPTTARNGVIANGIITQLQLATGVTTLSQNLPLDPSGVVYNSVTRTPVSGATITISGPVGFTSADVVGGSLTQTTGADGMYQFLLNLSAPAGTYTLTVTGYPGGYLPVPSILIPGCGTTVAVVATPNPAVVQSSSNAPSASLPNLASASCPTTSSGLAAGAGTTQYFYKFDLTPGTSANVVNNHIAIDPILGGAITLSKKTPLVNVSRGDLVPYTITAINTLSATLGNIDLRDQLPPGFKFKVGTATLDGVPVAPVVSGRVLTWPNLTFIAHQSRVIKLTTVVGSGVSEGNYVNQAYALNNIVNASVSNTATATVRVVPDPTFDCSDVIGKVFDDKNINGYQDAGEPGIPNVRLATVNGLLVTTDAQGRYHVTCAMVPNELRGSNFLMKLDERTLPTGFRVTTENPRDVRLTRGKMSKLNFGATIHRVVRLDVNDAAYTADALKAEWKVKLEQMPELLKQRPSVLRLAYKVGADGEETARKRLKALSQEMRAKWKAKDCCHLLQIEEELIQPSAVKREGK